MGFLLPPYEKPGKAPKLHDHRFSEPPDRKAGVAVRNLDARVRIIGPTDQPDGSVKATLYKCYAGSRNLSRSSPWGFTPSAQLLRITTSNRQPGKTKLPQSGCALQHPSLPVVTIIVSPSPLESSFGITPDTLRRLRANKWCLNTVYQNRTPGSLPKRVRLIARRVIDSIRTPFGPRKWYRRTIFG